MVKRQHLEQRNAIMGLFYVAVIIFAVICLYLAIKWGQGDISCSFGKFFGITGQLYIDHDSIQALPKLIDSTTKFVHTIRDDLLASKESRKATINKLNGQQGPMGQPFMLIATVTTDEQVKGDMLNDGWKDNHRTCRNNELLISGETNPFCTAKILPQKGKNLLNYRAPDGTYMVREWMNMARRRGSAWAGAWWRNSVGVVVPKIYYILNVPGSDLLIVSWFWTGDTFNDIYVGYTEQELGKLDSGRKQTQIEIKAAELYQEGEKLTH